MNRITSRQIVILGIIYVLPFAIDRVSAIMPAKQHIYISYILATTVFIVILWMLMRSAKRFPNQDLFQSLTIRFPVLGRGIGYLYLLFFLYILARDIRIMNDYTNVILLPETPLFFIAICLVVTVVFITRGGIQTLFSLTELLGPIFMWGLLFMVILLFKDFNVGNVMPILDLDMKGIGQGTWLVLSSTGQIIALPFIISSKDYRYRDPLYSLLIGTFLVILVAVMLILVVGVPIAERLMYPTYELVRQVRITDFMDRFDLLLVSLWYPLILINMAITLYVICYGLKVMIPSVSGKMMVAPVGLLAFSCSAWFFQDALQVLDFNNEWTWIAIIFEIIIPIGIFAMLRPRKASLKP
ncbi:spore germination protein [Paenibacillus sp. DS2015]|uniref:GerAB/ArcD/ProY family transporter n=1 Tax=Paenibacillus sp. DS2015 TaxID=3373917 RepID=UPI003D23749A